jgi:hypothetical protein
MPVWLGVDVSDSDDDSDDEAADAQLADGTAA